MSTVTALEPSFEVMPTPSEDALYEIVDGQYEDLFPMSTQAVVVASRLMGELRVFVKSHHLGEVVAEALFGLKPKARRKHRPDVAFVSYKRWPKDRPFPVTDPWPVVPELAVEVVSPNDLADGVQAKVKEYLEAGVQLVWLVYPQLTWVVAFESIQRARGYGLNDELDADPVLPGFRLSLRELFDGLVVPVEPEPPAEA